MQINLSEQFTNDRAAQRGAEIVRQCVHCGFCNATCPTYQLLGDEADGPRGRVYQISQLLQGQTANTDTRLHLDRCLMCRSCETTCPSGVPYAELLEIGRALLADKLPRSGIDKITRKVLTTVVPNQSLMQAAKLGIPFRPLLSEKLASNLPEPAGHDRWPEARHSRRMLVLAGCAQSVLTPATNLAAARVLDRVGISLIKEAPAGCCGAVRLHTDDREGGLEDIKRRIDTWWPQIEAGVEAIVSSASGCGVTIKDYAHLLADDPSYAQKASKVSEMAIDLSEAVLSGIQADASQWRQARSQTVAFHTPCSLQHGLGLGGQVEQLLQQAGYQLVPVRDGHLCCGSAGTYSILQPEISQQLKANKLDALQAEKPDIIATANIGCQLHLKGGADVPVVHWISLLDEPEA